MLRRCLVVDDNERVLEVARLILESQGLEVVRTATSIAGALSEAAEARPDVVLVDIALGYESGFELAGQLVKDFPELHSRIVLISSRDEEDFRELIASSPAVGFLPKSRLSAAAVIDLLGSAGR